METPAIIGVIGGMGPYAGLDLVKKIFDQTEAHTDQEHLPVALYSYGSRIPDRGAFMLGAETVNPGEPIADIALRLAGEGARAIGIPCNTAHLGPIFSIVRERLAAAYPEVCLLNMIDVAAQYVREEMQDVQRVGVLSTLAVYRLGLYPEALARLGLEAVVPDENVQVHLVNPAIYDQAFGIKGQSNPVSKIARQSLVTAVDHLRDKGAEAIVLGCTELPMALPETEVHTVPLIDATKALARALILATSPDRLKTA